MGFKIGKFLGKAVGSLVKRIPTAIAGFAAGGPIGALAAVGTSLVARAAQPRQPSQQMFGGVQPLVGQAIRTSFGGPRVSPQFGTTLPPMAQPVAGEVMLTQNIFNIILKLAQGLGIVIRSPGSVVRIGRRIIARLLRFARANPGLTILNLLVNVGLTAFEAQELLTWFVTHAKKHRRIKVTNVKALNRSVRRLEGFRRLSHRVEMALARRGSTRPLGSRRRCPKCRKSPCCC